MDMNNFVNIIGLLAMVITWFIVSPLKEAIQALRISVEKMSDSLEERRRDLTAIQERVAAGESTIKSNTKRISHLEDMYGNLCRDCKCQKD